VHRDGDGKRKEEKEEGDIFLSSLVWLLSPVSEEIKKG